MAQQPAFNPDGSPNTALNAYRLRAIKGRKDKGQVTRNFNLREFSAVTTAPSSPSAATRGSGACASPTSSRCRAKFGSCVVLSGYRHRPYNRSIGGAVNSVHIYDVTPSSVAADVRFAKGSPKQWGAYAKELRSKYKKGGGIGVYMRHGFVHVDT